MLRIQNRRFFSRDGEEGGIKESRVFLYEVAAACFQLRSYVLDPGDTRGSRSANRVWVSRTRAISERV